MCWKSVALAGCLLPVLAGCGSVRTAPAELQVARAPVAPAGDLHTGAGAAWQRVRAENPDRAFSGEFRDGFIDGYSDALARRTAPLVPAKSAPGDQGAAPDYAVGFRYGSEVAASGWRLPAPAGAARPMGNSPGAAQAVKTGAPAEPRPAGREGPIPKLPKPEIPVIPPFDPPLPGGTYLPLPVPPSAELPPAPKPRPVPPDEPSSAIPPTSLPTLPASASASSPPVPESVRVPSIFDDIPVVPFQYPAPGK
jgi:hypothetical protein